MVDCCAMNTDKLKDFVEQVWNDSIIPELTDYIRIPNKSPLFDPEWQAHGHMEQVVQQFQNWALAQQIRGLQLEVVRLPERTPLIYMEITGDSEETILLYGHLDKQPEMKGWKDGLGPWTPVIKDDKLYGRGGADDGYAMFSSLTAIKALQDQGIAHARCVVIIEACEESGSYDLPFYIDALSERIGSPDLVVCLDSGCGNYDQLWCTTSLRGLAGGDLHINVLREGVHSGDASGIVPSSFRILRQLLSRLEEQDSATIKLEECQAEIPPQRLQQAALAAGVLGDEIYARFPFAGDTEPASRDLAELVLNRTWRPTLSVVGADGIPAIADAGNVLRAGTSVKISMRLPPSCDAERASQKMKAVLETDPPHNASVEFVPDWAASGWDAPPVAAWLEDSLAAASNTWFGKPAMYMGEGGSIPFMGMLGEKFPEAQFLITGVLGPKSNAHGPNEFLHIPTAKRLTCCVASVIADHFKQVG